MGVNTKTIKRRIKSVGNTKKITKALEMISAVKMRKAITNVLATRNYAKMAWGMLQDIGKITDVSLHPLLQKRPVKKVGIIMITSNRGMAGGFSSKLLIELDKFIKKAKIDGADAEVILLGKRGRKIYKNFGHTVVAEFDKIDLTTKIEEILPMARAAVGDYISGKYDKLCVAYTDYVSAIKQEPVVKQLLPFVGEKEDIVGTVKENKNEVVGDLEFTFEPNPLEVLDLLIPRLVEMQIYQAILESDASEHSARMMSMRNASDAATDIIKELNYTYNKARQSAITQEIAEIVGGAAALG
jgi:F-type H+-transporting ATPase subunit gamma